MLTTLGNSVRYRPGKSANVRALGQQQASALLDFLCGIKILLGSLQAWDTVPILLLAPLIFSPKK